MACNRYIERYRERYGKKIREVLFETTRNLNPKQAKMLSGCLVIIFFFAVSILYDQLSTIQSTKRVKLYPTHMIMRENFDVCVSGALLGVHFSSWRPIEDEIAMILDGDLCSGFFSLGDKIQQVPFNQVQSYRSYELPQTTGKKKDGKDDEGVLLITTHPAPNGVAPSLESATLLSTLCPDDNCVLMGKFQQCSSLARPESCIYFTFLEDPMERMITDYVQFCKNGAGNNRYFTNKNLRMGADQLNCPHVSFLEFATFFGNVHVNEFSGAYKAEDCGVNNGMSHEESCGRMKPTTDVHLTRAKRFLKKEGLVFIKEDYLEGLRSLSSLIGGRKEVRLDKEKIGKKIFDKNVLNLIENTGKVYRPGKGTLQKAAQHMQHDLMFYSAMKTFYESTYLHIQEKEFR